MTGRLQCTALQYLFHRKFEAGVRFKGARKNLQHIAAADIEAVPAPFRDHLIPWDQFSPLRSTFDQIRQNAAQILKSLPKRGPLKKEARNVLVDALADIYEEVTDQIASKVSKEPGPFERFVRAALEPIDPHALTNIRDIIDAVEEPMTITITAFERSPDGGKGLARDTRVRWAREEVGQPRGSSCFVQGD